VFENGVQLPAQFFLFGIVQFNARESGDVINIKMGVIGHGKTGFIQRAPNAW
jgi:hypothetical protein